MDLFEELEKRFEEINRMFDEYFAKVFGNLDKNFSDIKSRMQDSKTNYSSYNFSSIVDGKKVQVISETNDKDTCMQYIGPDLAPNDDETEVKNYHYTLSINSDNDDYSIAKQDYSESNDDSTLNTNIEMSADEKNSLIKIFKDHKLLHDDYQLPQHKVKKLSNAA